METTNRNEFVFLVTQKKKKMQVKNDTDFDFSYGTFQKICVVKSET